MLTEEKVVSFLEEKFSEEGFEDCFLVDMELKGTSSLSVFIDSVKGVSFDTCRSVSRFLESEIEEGGLMDAKYKLEVSSPGVDRPLKFLKQYPKHMGRELDVKTTEGDVRGKLVEVEDAQIVIEVKPGGKKKAPAERKAINFDSIKSAKVLVSFK